jgi:hypothetical protein
MHLAIGRAMDQAVSYRPLTVEVRISTWVSSFGICDRRSDTGEGFTPTSRAFPCQCHSTMVLHTHMTSGG